jgi:hypothetical protein
MSDTGVSLDLDRLVVASVAFRLPDKVFSTIHGKTQSAFDKDSRLAM